MFALPFSVRNDPTMYEWVLYRALHSLGEMGFVGPSAYLTDYAARREAQGWAMWPGTQEFFGYEIPDLADLTDNVHLSALEANVLTACAERHLRPHDIWAETINGDLPELEQAVVSALAKLPARPEGLMFWTNCRAAKTAARVLGIPSIHSELGPLRSPWFRKTVYFDFEGVNGTTSAVSRWTAFCAENPDVPVLSREALLDMLQVTGAKDPLLPHYPTGVALQVADDSNLIAFGRGFSAVEVLSTARRFSENILARPHPNMPERFEMPGIAWDDSPTPADFLNRIDHLVTVNSSMALEGMLRGVRVSMLGETPFREGGWDIATGRPYLEDEARLRWLNWIVFGYLMPEENLFDAEYYRWRLEYPTEGEIYRRNHHHWTTAVT